MLFACTHQTLHPHLLRTAERELRPGGENIPVTASNYLQYVHCVANYKLNTQIASQTSAFLRGFEQFVPLSWIRCFHHSELQSIFSGDADGVFDVEDLRAHTRYSGGYSESSATVRSFWEVVQEMSNKDRAALLRFVTSCSRPPMMGFVQLQPQFCLHYVPNDAPDAPSSFFGGSRSKDTGRLPTAATCFNMLKLPAFKHKENLKEKLLQSIHSGAGFDLS